MSAYNKILLIGRLKKDQEMRYTKTGKPVASFTIAVNRNKVQGQTENQADFIQIIAWNKLAEICASYLTKGKLILVDGRLQTRSYENKEGQKVRTFEVVAQTMQMLDRSQKGSDASGGSDRSELNEIDLDANPDDIFSEEVPF